MADLQIQNRTRNPYKIPLVSGEFDNSAERMISVGGTGVIDADKHALLMAGNRAYGALISQNKLRVSTFELGEVAADELENTAAPEKPADLEESPIAEGAEGGIAATVESKGVEMVEVPLTPGQKGAATRAANKAASEGTAPPAQQ